MSESEEYPHQFSLEIGNGRQDTQRFCANMELHRKDNCDWRLRINKSTSSFHYQIMTEPKFGKRDEFRDAFYFILFVLEKIWDFLSETNFYTKPIYFYITITDNNTNYQYSQQNSTW